MSVITEFPSPDYRSESNRSKPTPLMCSVCMNKALLTKRVGATRNKTYRDNRAKKYFKRKSHSSCVDTVMGGDRTRGV